MKILSDGFSEIAALAYGGLPASLRRALLPVTVPAFSLARRVPSVLAQFRMPLVRLEGAERNHGRPLAILTCARPEALPFLCDLVFSRVDRSEDWGPIRLRDMSRAAELAGKRADLAFVHADVSLARSLGASGFRLLPEWIDMSFDLSTPLRETWRRAGSKTLRENLRRIRKYGYEYVLTTERREFDRFYRQMYLPFIPERFGAATQVVGPHKMRRFFESGALLLVKRDGEPVAGNIILVFGGQALSLVAGLRQGDRLLLRQSALAASYYFTLLWAESRRLRRVDFGGCRPLLRDGLVYFKKSWDMSVGPSRSGANVYGLRLLRPSPAALDFLAGNPFIYLQGSRLRGFVLSASRGPMALSEVRELSRTLFIPGLEGLDIYSPPGFGSEAAEGADPGPLIPVVRHGGPVGEFFRSNGDRD